MVDELLTSDDVAQMLQVHKGFVYRLVSDGKLKAVVLGKKCFRFKKEDVENFLEQQTK